MTMQGETKQTRLTRAMTQTVSVMGEYADTAWPGQLVYMLECLQSLGRADYETRLEALRESITQRLESGHW